MPFPIPLEPDGVSLRLLEAGDGRARLDAYERNREHLAPWDPERSEEFFTEEHQAGIVATMLESHAEGNALPLVIADGESIVGFVNLSSIVRGILQNAVLGYWLDRSYTGRGIMGRAVNAVIAVARDELELHSLQAGTLVNNVASQRILLGAGFERIGIAPRYLKIAGSWQDHILFQRLLED